jgi:Tat protein secretion system quality control protein TatD with DNase activity
MFRCAQCQLHTVQPLSIQLLCLVELNSLSIIAVSSQGWQERLHALLEQSPRAIVGEIGIDRAARVPGTPYATSYDHQWSLFTEQMALAAQLKRPVRNLPACSA